MKECSRAACRIAGVLLLGCAMPVSAQNSNAAPAPASAGSAGAAGDAARSSAGAPREQRAGPAMERIVSLGLRDVTLESALDAIERQAGIKLQYTPRVVPVDKRVTVRLDHVTVAAALEEVLRGTGVKVAVTTAGATRATAIANTTIVMIGERCSRSAMSQTAKVPTNWTITEVATSRMRVFTARVTRASARPSTMLPTVTTSSIGTTLHPDSVPATTAPTARR